MSFFLHMQNALLQHKIVIVGKNRNTLIFMCIFLRYLGELYNYNFDTQGCWRVESLLRYPCPPSFEVTCDFTNLIVAPNPKSILIKQFTTAKLRIHTYGGGSKWLTTKMDHFLAEYDQTCGHKLVPKFGPCIMINSGWWTFTLFMASLLTINHQILNNRSPVGNLHKGQRNSPSSR